MTRWAALLVVAGTLALGWFFRWEVVETHTADRPAAIFLVNRWTGEIRYVQGNGWLRVEPE